MGPLEQCRAKRVCLADYDVARGSVGAWYCSDSAERRSNRTMSNRVKQRCIIQDVHLFTSIYNTSLFSSSSVDSSTSQYRLPDVQLPRHSAVSSCPSYFLAPPTPPFPLNPCPRRQRPRRHCVAPTKVTGASLHMWGEHSWRTRAK